MHRLMIRILKARIIPNICQPRLQRPLGPMRQLNHECGLQHIIHNLLCPMETIVVLVVVNSVVVACRENFEFLVTVPATPFGEMVRFF